MNRQDLGKLILVVLAALFVLAVLHVAYVWFYPAVPLPSTQTSTTIITSQTLVTFSSTSFSTFTTLSVFTTTNSTSYAYGYASTGYGSGQGTSLPPGGMCGYGGPCGPLTDTATYCSAYRGYFGVSYCPASGQGNVYDQTNDYSDPFSSDTFLPTAPPGSKVLVNLEYWNLPLVMNPLVLVFLVIGLCLVFEKRLVQFFSHR